jgi:pyruvate ferredoxin oxidoreductase beta subunit/2-oxoisovalerate ferredoxin oxidoreductase beta subunit
MHAKPKLSGRRIHSIPGDEIYSKGHLACPGCGVAICARLALQVLGRKTILVVPACCFAVIDGPFPCSAAGVPLLHCAFETAAATASGVKAGLLALGDTETTVVAWAGDGGTYDIGFQALSAAAERNEDILYVCYDNEAYMNTGIQRSGATPFNAWTTTTPAYPGKPEAKKDLAAIMIAHRIPYFATASVSYVEDFLAKFRKAKSMKGFRFLHLLSPCSPGWKVPEADTIELGYLAVKSRVFPLIEVEDGGRVRRVNMNPRPIPVKRYLERQGRFKHLAEADMAAIQGQVDRRWAELTARCEMPHEEVAPAPERPVVRGPRPARRELAQRLRTMTAEEHAAVDEMLAAMWQNPAHAAQSDEELIGLAATRVQLTGSL